MGKKQSKQEKKQENTEINTNLEQFSISQQNVRKSRHFSLVTYVSEKQLKQVLTDHVRSLRAAAYIWHDKEEAEPHYHVLLRTHSTWTARQISKWFGGLLDKEGNTINTFAEIPRSMDAMEEYILHWDQTSIEKGKHRYEKSDIVDYGLLDLTDRKDCFDTSYEILLKVLAGVSPRELVRYYGRDYLYHHNQYHDVAEKIQHNEALQRWRHEYDSGSEPVPSFETVEDMEAFR